MQPFPGNGGMSENVLSGTKKKNKQTDEQNTNNIRSDKAIPIYMLLTHPGSLVVIKTICLLSLLFSLLRDR